MKTIIIIALVLFVSGYLFVRWANAPENVAALQQKRLIDAADKESVIQELKKEQEAIREKIADLRCVIHEDFKTNKFTQLHSLDSRTFRFENHEAIYSNLVTQGQLANAYFVLSDQSFTDFVAEIEFEISGEILKCGIVWDCQLEPSEQGAYPSNFQGVYSGPSTYIVQTTERVDRLIGGYFSVFRNQKVRVERIGQHVKATLNDKVLYDKKIDQQSKGKVGIYGTHNGGVKYPTTIYCHIKSFKVFG